MPEGWLRWSGEAALANSPETLRTLEECGLPLTQVGHVAVLERGRGARASLVTSPMGAAAWGLKMAALKDSADRFSYVKSRWMMWMLSNVAGTVAEVIKIGQELVSFPDLDTEVKAEDFAWALGATPLILAVQAAGRGTHNLKDPDEAGHGGCTKAMWLCDFWQFLTCQGFLEQNTELLAEVSTPEREFVVEKQVAKDSFLVPKACWGL
eukprot:s242_g8.t3